MWYIRNFPLLLPNDTKTIPITIPKYFICNPFSRFITLKYKSQLKTLQDKYQRTRVFGELVLRYILNKYILKLLNKFYVVLFNE